jgi:phosphoribosylamine--glycine ligase
MKVVVIGARGREHAIVWKLFQSRHINRIYCCPGNAGMAEMTECIDLSPNDFLALIDFVKYEWVDVTIVGSGELFSKGIVDVFENEGCRILGPVKAASQIGSSRVFAKDLMRLHRIPTSEFKVFTSYLHAQDYVRLKGAPIVIKTERSFDENGVFMVSKVEEAIDALRLIMKDRIFAEAGKRVIVEESIMGEMVSFIVLTDGKVIVPLTSLHKHKCIFNSDKGSGAVSMGAYSPSPILTKELETTIMERIIRPTLKALDSGDMQYKGILSADLIIEKGNPYVFEFNCSFGDLEAQTILPRLKTDFMDISLAIIGERLSDIDIEWKQEASVCIAILSRWNSGKYKKSAAITGLERIKAIKDVFVFHESTLFNSEGIFTSGERVVSITATGGDLQDAKIKAYGALEEIHCEGLYYRPDIMNDI